MKKLLGMLGLLLGLSVVGFAGTPMDQPAPGLNPYSNSTIYLSTFSVSANWTQTNLSLVPGSISNGGASQSCRNCFTRFFVQIPTTTVIDVLDGSATDYYIAGIGLGASGVNTLNVSAPDHLGPTCFTAGQTTWFTITNTLGNPTVPVSFTAEGYTQCGQNNQGGLMK